MESGRYPGNYARLDANGVAIVFECLDVTETKRYLDDFPMTRAGLFNGKLFRYLLHRWQ